MIKLYSRSKTLSSHHHLPPCASDDFRDKQRKLNTHPKQTLSALAAQPPLLFLVTAECGETKTFMGIPHETESCLDF